MRTNHILSLIQANFRTVKVAFDTPEYRVGQAKQYTYKVPLALEVAVDDVLVVKVKDEFKLVRVLSLDPLPDIDTSLAVDYKWIVQKVDATAYEAQLLKEVGFRDALREIERIRVRQHVLNELQTNLPPGSEARQLFDTALQSAGLTLAAPATPEG